MRIKSVIVSLSMLLSAFAMANGTVPAGTYNIDPMHSKVGFVVDHLVISTVDGRFNSFEGKIIVNDKVEKSNVNVMIDTASISTGVDKRDEHLKSSDFFDVAKFPKINFVSKKVSATSEGLKVIGKLTIKKVTKDVTLDVVYAGKVKDAYGQDKIAFTANTEISRKDFGISYGAAVEAGPVIGDKVKISLVIQAAAVVQEAAKAKK